MMKYYSYLLFFVVLAFIPLSFVSHVYAQKSEDLQFSETTFDFGKIKEEDGPVTHEFTFINHGHQPVQIANVRASCGCTTPAWTKEPVLPGQSGLIQAQYNPKNRPGPFNKSLTVTMDSSDRTVRLYIKGQVEPKPRSLEEDLPIVTGGLRMKYRSFNLGRVKTTEEPTIREFGVYNASKDPIEFLDSIIAPNHIDIDFIPQTLQPQEHGTIKVSYHAKTLDELGFRNDNIAFYTNEVGEDALKSVSVYATLQEYFPPMSEAELQKAPKLKIMNGTYDFGRLRPGKKVSTDFTLVNEGIDPLEIRMYKSNCNCVTAQLTKTTLLQGEETTIKVNFDAEGRRGNQQKSVTIFSNDPRASAQRVTIKAYVELQGR